MALLAPLKAIAVLVPALAVVYGLLQTGLWQLNGKSGQTIATSEPKTYTLSNDPVVVYVKDFVSEQEAAHLVELAKGGFAPSPMWDNDGKPHIDKAYRLSMTAKLDRTDMVIKRLEDRARSFPFYKNLGDFMPIVVQNYGIAGQYRDHYDWFDDAHAVGGNIASTFFVYIHANCTGGGTNFARLTPPNDDDESWCEFIDCDRPLDEGVTFKPILGNAIYWENLHADDSGHVLTLHAGMPVTSGNKMGMNMWTWKTT
ncbi:putative prolyl 4-hydroxylase alpha subunit [Talaromyces proteolyticus]|uniref:Prolyl 4-hydroxylase alpha subunit n=1 Tax=Talaromyces proteolyticus TaxID=1131652 RepID=A0AAD4Q4X1_9EURO|nr:putative prolyl 4-hydroxylase alpha subunit [Talaromyces proteolyticus]KAH8703564.1 putative prolyl 4-hydroxylase alpha subunit [Talaromyces proteolyticus]